MREIRKEEWRRWDESSNQDTEGEHRGRAEGRLCEGGTWGKFFFMKNLPF